MRAFVDFQNGRRLTTVNALRTTEFAEFLYSLSVLCWFGTCLSMLLQTSFRRKHVITSVTRILPFYIHRQFFLHFIWLQSILFSCKLVWIISVKYLILIGRFQIFLRFLGFRFFSFLFNFLNSSGYGLELSNCLWTTKFSGLSLVAT